MQNCKDLSYPERLRYLKLPTLAYRRVRGDMIQVYKIMHGLVGIKKESVFTMVETERGTRGNIFKIQKQHARLTLSCLTVILNPWALVVSTPSCRQAAAIFTARNLVRCPLNCMHCLRGFFVRVVWQFLLQDQCYLGRLWDALRLERVKK